MNGQSEKVKGTVNTTMGKAKEVVGETFNNKTLESEGFSQKNEGKAQHIKGSMKESIQKGTQVLGDAIEKMGQGLRDKGHVKIGNSVEKFGDKVEHLAD